jgi:hypothetical protein
MPEDFTHVIFTARLVQTVAVGSSFSLFIHQSISIPGNDVVLRITPLNFTVVGSHLEQPVTSIVASEPVDAGDVVAFEAAVDHATDSTYPVFAVTFKIAMSHLGVDESSISCSPTCSLDPQATGTTATEQPDGSFLIMDTPRVLVTTAQGIATFYLDVLAPSESFSVSFSAIASNTIGSVSTVTLSANLTFQASSNFASVFSGGSKNTILDVAQPSIERGSVTSSIADTADTPNIDLTIGESLDLPLAVRVPEGRFPLTFQLSLASGIFTVMAVEVTAIGANINRASLLVSEGHKLQPATLLSNGTLRSTLSLGSAVENVADNLIDEKDLIIITVTVILLNVANPNFRDRSIPLLASIQQFVNSTYSVSITAVEPKLQLAEIGNFSSLDAGDLFVQNVVVSYQSLPSLAYRIYMQYAVSSALTYLPQTLVGCIYNQSLGIIEGNMTEQSCQAKGADGLLDLFSGVSVFDLSVDRLPAGHWIHVQFASLIKQEIDLGKTIRNPFVLTYYSAPQGLALNGHEYTFVSESLFSTASPKIFFSLSSKNSTVAVSDLTVGQPANVSVRVQIPESFTTIQLKVKLPPNVAFSASHIMSLGALVIERSSVTMDVTVIDSETLVTFSFPEILNVFDNVVTDGDFIEV